MEVVDLAIVGAGPAGSACAAFAAAAGLRTIVLEREKFPREKVCGDCLNPSCWPVLQRLDLAGRVRGLPHGKLDAVEFIAIDGAKVALDLPRGDESEIAVKRSLLDALLVEKAREQGALISDSTVVSTIDRERWGDWRIDIVHDVVRAKFLVAADGRNSTVARLRNLLPKPARERVALQSHIPLPNDFGNKVVLQFLRQGYSGQAPVNETELNVCLVGRPGSIAEMKTWAENFFHVSPWHTWRTITPLTRAPISPAHDNLLFIGDAARVVEPFTGEGIYYALRSGELAAHAIARMARGENRESVVRQFVREHGEMYRGRLWINQLARAAVLSPRIASALLNFFPKAALRMLASKVVPADPGRARF